MRPRKQSSVSEMSYFEPESPFQVCQPRRGDRAGDQQTTTETINKPKHSEPAFQTKSSQLPFSQTGLGQLCHTVAGSVLGLCVLFTYSHRFLSFIPCLMHKTSTPELLQALLQLFPTCM